MGKKDPHSTKLNRSRNNIFCKGLVFDKDVLVAIERGFSGPNITGRNLPCRFRVNGRREPVLLQPADDVSSVFGQSAGIDAFGDLQGRLGHACAPRLPITGRETTTTYSSMFASTAACSDLIEVSGLARDSRDPTRLFDRDSDSMISTVAGKGH
ncbi:hypothetical protein [Sulfidibacter corallicola]|uniref:Uncharacterized protein n=1 Tax=Sulfidibacter corallicola TaxID=2818388 RepID=A0A8A4THQ3_SULCO|nr:hypothetical protein [Sulfidibacter corallicola]QTD49027.1 hypothetical protein J3U87_25865 [Sulfidibacter corallicola]